MDERDRKASVRRPDSLAGDSHKAALGADSLAGDSHKAARPAAASPDRLRSLRPGAVVRRLVMALFLVAGLALILYPIVGTFLNERSFSDAVARYDETVAAMPEDERLSLLAEAHAYNESLRGDPVRDPFVANSGYAVPDNYDDVLDVDGTGLMGTVSIPSIDVRLPIYHGTSDEVLAHGAGHIPQTSLPVGGAGTHSVITGHTGLPTARLFTDLDKLEIGDVFIIEILGEKHAYAVDNIEVVEPADVSSIRVDAEHDYVTLLTCTPYGINSHRLLVRGTATELPAEDELAPRAEPLPIALIVGTVAVAAVAVAAAGFVLRRRSQRKAGQDEA